MKQHVIKIISVPISIVLGMFFNQVAIETYFFRARLGHSGLFQQLFILLAEIVFFYMLIQLIAFRTRYWLRIEIIIACLTYIGIIFVGLLVRGIGFSSNTEFFDGFYLLNQIDYNPFSFISDFIDDRSSIVVAVINLVLFLPLPFVLSFSRIKPRFGYAIVLFVSLETAQLLLQQGYFSISDIILYSLGFVAGKYLLKLTEQRQVSANL